MKAAQTEKQLKVILIDFSKNKDLKGSFFVAERG